MSILAEKLGLDRKSFISWLRNFRPWLVLGLDLGPNSVGWSVMIDDPNNPANSRIVDLGVRVFPEGVDNFETSKEFSRNEDRRIARGMRRQIRRRARRRWKLQESLMTVGFWPSDPEQQKKLYLLDPYELRARAIRERLEPFEIGRVLMHLNQRRGFLSNSKKDRRDKEVQGMLAEINDNERQRLEGGFATIGSWLADKHTAMNHKDRKENDCVRNRHLARRQYEDEFEAIWSEQSKYHAVLTNELKYGKLGKQKYPAKPIPRYDERRQGISSLEAFGIYGTIFFQRRMYWPKSVVGQCELLPNRKRCAKADRMAQRFRLLQEVNNLKVIDDQNKEERRLTDDERKLLLEKLSRKEEMKFEAIIKELQKVPTFPSSEHVRLNLQAGKRTKLQGAAVDAMIANVVGKTWHKRPEEEKNAIVGTLLELQHDDDECIRRLQKNWQLSVEQAEDLTALALPQGYVNLSREAIERLLPHMEEGLIYMANDDSPSALAAAGFERPDQLRRWVFGKLPNAFEWRDSPLGDLPNPIVRRTLVELRKVVNAIVREYGRPAAIHVEMARDMSPRPKPRTEAYRKYQARIERMRELEEAHDIAEAWLRENGKVPNRENRIRYLLWKEQGEICIYSGKPISPQQLFGGEVDVDHIWPRSKCLDNSQSNRVVCFRKTADRLGNHDKGQRTPYEWLAHDRADAYEQLCQRARKLPYPKYRRFLTKELKVEDFVERQLCDTRYIAKAAGEYVRCLFDFEERKRGAVLGLKGQLTSELRWQWGLETILEELPDSPAWRENGHELRPGEKNRADHRHHAIDAVVIALTNRRRLHQLSDIVKRGGAKAHGEVLEDPWPNFREDVVQAIKKVNVSHRVERKVAGKLHEETLYGPTPTPGEWVVRKPVISLSPNEIERIRDDKIREVVVAALKKGGIDFGRGKKPDAKKMKTVLSNLKMPSEVRIKKVRIIKPELTIQSVRTSRPDEAFVKPGSTHHLCIFELHENGKSKREAVFVTMLEAMNRLKRGEPVVQRKHPQHPDAKFIMSLSSREMVLANWKDGERLLTFKTAASTQGQIYFAEHTDARRSSDQAKFVATANSLDARKVTVDPLGRIRWAND